MATENVKAVLSACLADPDTVRVLAPMLDVDDFPDMKDKVLWACLLDLYAQKEKPSFVSVVGWLEVQKKTKDVTLEYVAEIRDYLDFAGIDSTANAPKWASEVVEAAERRKLADLVEKVKAEAKDLSKPVDEVLAKAVADLQGVRRQRGSGFRSPVSIKENIMAMADEWFSGGKGGAIGTGFETLDPVLGGGLRPRMLYVFGARPGMCKTAFSWAICENIAKEMLQTGQDGCVAVMSLEMSMDELVVRGANSIAGIENRELMAGAVRGKIDQQRWYQSFDDLCKLPIRIDDTYGLTSAAIRFRVSMLDAVEKVRFLVIDFAEMVGDESEGEELRVSGIFKSAKALAKDLNIPVMLLSQLSREVERSENKVPNLRHLRYGGSAEAIADYAMFAYDPYKYHEMGESIVPADGTTCDAKTWYLLVEKARYGKPGFVPFRFDRPFLRWYDSKVSMKSRNEF